MISSKSICTANVYGILYFKNFQILNQENNLKINFRHHNKNISFLKTIKDNKLMSHVLLKNLGYIIIAFSSSVSEFIINEKNSSIYDIFLINSLSFK